jgi:hypothetical protein
MDDHPCGLREGLWEEFSTNSVYRFLAFFVAAFFVAAFFLAFFFGVGSAPLSALSSAIVYFPLHRKHSGGKVCTVPQRSSLEL